MKPKVNRRPVGLIVVLQSFLTVNFSAGTGEHNVIGDTGIVR